MQFLVKCTNPALTLPASATPPRFHVLEAGTPLLIETKSQFVHVQNLRYIFFCWQNTTWTKIPPPIAWYFILHLYYYSILPIAAPHAGKLKITWILRKYVCISCKFTILHNYYLHYYHPGNIPSCKFTILQFTILQIYRLANLLSCKFTILDIYYLANGPLGKILSWNFTILENSSWNPWLAIMSLGKVIEPFSNLMT